MTDTITKEILTEKLDMIQDCNLGNLDFQMGAEYVCGVLRQWANLEAYKSVKDANIEKEITNYFHDFWPGTETAEQCNTDLHFTPLAILRLAEHFAKWGAEHRDRFLNWIRDLVKAGIKRPEEALNILKRIDTLINDNSLWAEHLKK